jgi:short-subunit dehydrogenase
MTVAEHAILITGAARGIGAELARTLTVRGAGVGLLGLEPERLAALSAELGNAPWAEADVTDQQALTSGVTSIVTALGGLDAVIANAGIATMGTVRQIDPAAFARTVDVNLVGVYRTVATTLPHLVARGGYVLVMSSLAAMAPTPGFAAYGASKAGVEAFATALRLETAHLGVDVGCAHPCWVDTDMVGDARRDLSGFDEFVDSLPWPMSTMTSVGECARLLADGIERRSRRVFVPRAGRLAHLIRALATSGPVEWLAERMAARHVPALEKEIDRLGRTRPERNLGELPRGRDR